jgi:cbb3-type cytochrome oxidase subunit 3
MSPLVTVLQWIEHYSVVAMTAVFLVIVISTYWPGRKSRIEQQGLIPFKDDV